MTLATSAYGPILHEFAKIQIFCYKISCISGFNHCKPDLHNLTDQGCFWVKSFWVTLSLIIDIYCAMPTAEPTGEGLIILPHRRRLASIPFGAVKEGRWFFSFAVWWLHFAFSEYSVVQIVLCESGLLAAPSVQVSPQPLLAPISVSLCFVQAKQEGWRLLV